MHTSGQIRSIWIWLLSTGLRNFDINGRSFILFKQIVVFVMGSRIQSVLVIMRRSHLTMVTSCHYPNHLFRSNIRWWLLEWIIIGESLLNLIDIHTSIQMIKWILLLKHTLLLSIHNWVTARIYLSVVTHQIWIEFQLTGVHCHGGTVAGSYILGSNKVVHLGWMNLGGDEVGG